MYTCDTWEEEKRRKALPLDLQIPEAWVMLRLVASQVYDIDDDKRQSTGGSLEVAPPLNPNAGATSQIWNRSAET